MRRKACLVALSVVFAACHHLGKPTDSADGGGDASGPVDSSAAHDSTGVPQDVDPPSPADGRSDQTGDVRPANGLWTTASRMPTARGYLAAVLGPDGRIYAIGGLAPGQAALRVVEAYDPAHDSWTTVAPLGIARYGLAAAVGSDGRIYAVGGNYDGTTDGNSVVVEAYDAAADTWTPAPSLTVGRYGAAAVTTSDKQIQVIGGFSRSLGDDVPTIDTYVPGARSWASRPGLMTTPRNFHVAVLALDGTIFAIGGTHDGINLSATEARSAGSNSWFTRADMPTPRMVAAAARDADGNILVFGGSGGVGASHLGTVEAYSPTTNSWRSLPDMPTARNALAAATGPDGRIYVMGGITGTVATAVAAVEVYRP
jgi:hypothetical protein